MNLPNKQDAINQILAAIYEQQVLPLKPRLVGKIVSNFFIGATGFALSFSDGSWIGAYGSDKGVIWKMSDTEFSKEMEALLDNGDPSREIDLIPRDKLANYKDELANTMGKEVASLSSGLLKGTRYIKFSFSNHGELYTIIGPIRNDRYSYWVSWQSPMRLIWRGEPIGYFVDVEIDMGYLEGCWESNESTPAKAFERLASTFDSKAVMRDWRLGTLIQYEFPGGKSPIGYAVVMGLKNRHLFIHWIIGKEAQDWVKNNVK
jgi:hypothetical protein